MQMIDVMKRLAALDATNPNVIDTNLKVVSPTQDFSTHERTELAECGMMPEMMSQDRPSTPASFNMTAATGEELSGMLKDIMSLAGLNKQPTDAAPGSMAPPAVAMSGPETSTDAMRSVIDKLNPDADTDGDGDGDAEDEEAREGLGGALGGAALASATGLGGLGMAGGALLGGGLTDDAEEETEEGWKGQLAGGTAGTLAGAAMGAMTPIPGGAAIGGALGGTAGQMMGDKMGGEEGDQDQEAEEDYDNTPADPKEVPEFDSEEYAHQENQPGSGNTANGQRRTTSQPTATYESLMKDYRQFIGETADENEDDVEEGIMDKAKAFGKKVLDKVGHGDDEDMIKDLQKKAGVPQTGKKPEKANESMADILRLSGLR